MKLRTKFFMLYLVVASCLTLAVGTALNAMLMEDNRETIGANISQQLGHFEFALSNFLSEAENDVAYISSLDAVTNRDDRNFSNFLSADETTFRYDYGPGERRIIDLFAKFKDTHPYVNSVYMGRENGSFVRSHERGKPTAYDPRQRPWYVLAMESPGKVRLTDAYSSITNADVNIGVVKALLGPDGKPYGVVGMDITLARLTDYVCSFAFRPEGSLLLLDEAGTILASPNKDLAFSSASAVSPEIGAFASGQANLPPEIKVAGKRLFAFSRDMSAAGWKVVVLVSRANVLSQGLRPIALSLACLAAVFVLLSVVSYLALTAFVVSPLRSFIRETGYVGRTAMLDRRIAVSAKDEIGELAASFNAMIDSLGNARQELQLTERKLLQHKDSLETIVRDRTYSLQALNDKLQREIADRERLDKALDKSESMYRDLVQGSNSIIMRLSARGEILFMNDFALDFFGFPGSEIIGRQAVGTILPERDASDNDMSLLIRNLSEKPEDYVDNLNENVLKSGKRVWVAWTNRPVMDASGGRAEILSVGNDVTRLIETERELRVALKDLAVEKDKAESADRIKSAFLATMSHELRTPLNSIIGFTGIIMKGMSGPLTEEQGKQLGMVMGSARHLLDLINDVLDISKIEAGQMTLAHDDFNLREIVQKACLEAQPMADRKGLEMRQLIGEGVGAMAGDSRRVGQVLLNLLSNSIKFTERGWIETRCAIEGDKAVVTVSDTGIGIKEGDMPALFQAFRQIDVGLTRKYEGTGLGLSISKRLVEIMGGEIWATSEWGSGSTFGFSLPLGGNRG